ncbi:MAG: hypothetical protein RL095_3046 [Verrucomicrobiota bacterium]|jgi:uncharacterized protein YbgA (DUF1722 family)/uncharacterized protein YbbK (DUF523 family)
MKPLLGISACLLGQSVRFNGGHCREDFLVKDLAKVVDWFPVCPEAEAGMGVPRETIRLQRSGDEVRLIGNDKGEDKTAMIDEVATRRLEEFKTLNLCGYVLKSASPSCGAWRVKLYRENGMTAKDGRGRFAARLMAEMPWLPVEEEGRLYDAALRENFLYRICALAEFRALQAAGSKVADLCAFHARHKYRLMSHNQSAMREIGRLLATHDGKKTVNPALAESYLLRFSQIVDKPPRRSNTANALTHMAGYLSDHLDSFERQHLAELIDQYRRELIPLIVPILRIREGARKYQQDYLLKQFVLTGFPDHLKLHNGL